MKIHICFALIALTISLLNCNTDDVQNANNKADLAIALSLIANTSNASIVSESSVARIRNRNSIPLAHGAYTVIPFSEVDYDTDGYYNSSLPDRLTIPVTGIYSVIGEVEYAANTIGVRKTNLIVNDGLSNVYVVAASSLPASGFGAYQIEASVGTNSRFNKGDTIKLQCFQDSGGVLSLQAASYASILTINKISN
ncbi:hypothetical protein M9Y90_18540 [Leptospira interrogans]|uniref:Uncharacterized protein n=1 Tax=Leptospira interrogans serovar Canicola TaxID=211880 RepID=A0AAQ0B096_LEPIR|nr:hypothetical protein [Leptospira interrogans]MCL8312645.1 hypothetical protein [Leptospira interrogans]QOI44976.1 hypothetical protein Lepto782_22535 [Leptospira interrogans serovar Canicola]